MCQAQEALIELRHAAGHGARAARHFDFIDARELLAEPGQRLWDALADGTLKPPQIEARSLDAAAVAHARLDSRRSTGSLVLVA